MYINSVILWFNQMEKNYLFNKFIFLRQYIKINNI